MKDHNGCIRGYHRTSKAYYAKSMKENIEINFGMFHPKGGTSGEMTMEWIEISGTLYAQLKSFEDSWSALSSFPDLIERMGKVDGEKIQEEEFAKMLDECGFKDLTVYESPHKEEMEPEMVTISIPKNKAEELGLLKKQ